jgi:hypothetical protein
MKQLRYALVAVLAAGLLAGCGEKKETLGDPTAVYGPGITASPPPWKPEYAHLKQRIKLLGLPPVGKEQFHTHALIHIYNDGLLVEVARNIGIDPKTNAYSSVHTHDTSGIVHMEADRTYPFTIGQFFAVWGVKFTDDEVGPYRSRDGDQLQVYVNGNRVTDAVNYVMHEHDNIVVGYGRSGSFPTNPPANFPPGY